MPPSDDLLHTGRVAHLATADRGGRPHVVPVCFAYLDGTVYTPLDLKPKRSSDPRHLRRVRNVLANRRAALVVDRYDEDWSRLAYVLVEGEAALVVDADEEQRAIAALRSKYAQYRDMPIVGMLRLRVEHVVAWP
ncbi:MAG TPA: TIGR03668 family PPOX class F420-dependent oxidoreductase [Candidatus Dormibacteraeota bacterium]|jgi:PPOX class probable F420-dependent enzyme|nr:TIGR03668 family PPOX class F420-dependent oxidoreductase [Candidatus Dormibacteraeota bacterium]